MTNTYVELYYDTFTAANLVFQFNPMPLNLDLNYEKTGVSNIDIPSQVRPIGFDMTSQQRQIRFEFILMNIANYSASTPGTGTYLDQMEDLDKAAQSLTEFGNATKYILVVPFSQNFTSGHTPSTANVGTVTASSGDKIFYVNFRSLHFKYEGGAPSYIKGEAIFEEVDPTSGVISI